MRFRLIRISVLPILLASASGSCHFYTYTPPDVKVEKRFRPSIAPWVTGVAVECEACPDPRLTLSPSLYEHLLVPHQWMMRRHLQREIERAPGMAADSTAEYRVTLTYRKGKVDMNAPATCLSFLTLYLVPNYQWETHYVDIQIFWKKERIGYHEFSYQRNLMLGWFIPIWNLFVTSHSDSMHITVASQLKAQEALFADSVQRMTTLVVGDIQQHRAAEIEKMRVLIRGGK